MASNKRSIPEIRVRLLELADELGCPELRELEAEMYRKAPVRRAPRVSDDCTAEMAEQIRAYANANPRESFHSIASRFNVNPGRVSEAMNGER